jgi:FtsP/CotA-like multicopper oxidase with cupredoxin domain
MRKLVPMIALLAACGGERAGDELGIVTLVDINPDPAVVEVEIVATTATQDYLPGKPADTWAYRDGTVAGSKATTPGPLLDVPQGAHVIVHFRNELPDATTIHWHGLRVPNASDGTPAAQVPVAPGDTYDYEFDAEDAGLFWYHPHVEGDVQVERGLYAPVVVRGGVEPDVSEDRVLVLDDIKLEATGKLSTTTDPLDVMMGRQGNVLLANGHANATLAAEAGSRERWRFVNAANGRFFNLALPGHTFFVIGWDGGMLAEPYPTDTLLIAPGERYDVLVELDDSAGSSVPLQTLYYDRGHNLPDPGPQTILTVDLSRRASAPPMALPTTWGAITPLPVDATTTVRTLVLDEQEQGLAEPVFTINGAHYPEMAPIVASANQVEIWELRNDAEMDHPFHLHGTFFQVLDVAGVAPAHAGWKDTVNVPMKTTLRFAVRYGGAGRWMFHCHILEHAERGMMGELDVSP